MQRLSATTWVVLLSGLCACGRPAPVAEPAASTPEASAPTGEVLATVNGVAIHPADLERAASRSGHEEEPAAGTTSLESVIRAELAAQEATRLGLDRDVEYQKKLASLQAEVDAYRRRALSDALYAHQVSASAPTPEEEHQYFDAHQDELREQLHIEQILTRDEAGIAAARDALATGTPFEKVAAARFEKLPAGVGKPWDLGFLRWSQLPEAWRAPLAGMAPGQVSDILRGPGGRFWIVRLVERRVGPEVTLDEARPQIVEALTRDHLDAERQSTDRRLREQAVIVYAGGATAPAGQSP